MLGRASWMRLPDIVGVELSGKRAARHHRHRHRAGADRVPAQGEGGVGAYLEFYGEGASSLTLGDRATISNMAPEFGATAAMFYHRRADHQLPAPDRPRGRAGRSWWKPTRRTPACGPTRWPTPSTSACCRSTCRPWCATWPARRNPHKRLPTSELAARGISGVVDDEPGQMPDGAVIIAAITSCTNTSNPRNMIAAGLLARNANRARPDRASRGSSRSLAPGSKAVDAVSGRSRPAARSWKSWASASSPSPAPPATACPARSTR